MLHCLRRACPGLVSVLALAPAGGAQDVTAYEGLDYGVSGANTGVLSGGDGGFGWNSAWMGPGIDGLLSWWPLDASARDAGPFGADGTVGNASYILASPPVAIWSTHALELKSARQSSVDFSAHASKFDGLMRGSITMWVRSTRQGILMAMFSASNANRSKSLQLTMQNGIVGYDVVGDLPSQGKIGGATDISDGFWHHVALTVESDGASRIFVDGAFETGGQQGFFGHVFDMDNLWLGRVQFRNPTRHFDGDVDDLAIWGTALSATEIQGLASLPPPLAPVAPADNGPVLASESLATTAFPNLAFGTRGLGPVGNRVSETKGASAARVLKNQIDLSVDRSYYLSCLLRRPSGVLNAAFEINFTDEFGAHCRFGWNLSNQWIAGLDKITTGPQVAVDTTYFAVFKVAAMASATDAAYLRVYGPGESVSATEPTGWTIAHGGESLSDKMSVIWLAHIGLGGQVEVDEIRLGKTWESVTRLGYGAGCLGAVIDKSNRPALGSGDFTVRLTGASASQVAFLNIGGSRTLWGVLPLPFDLAAAGAPGCSVLASFDVTVSTATNSGGFAAIPLPVPNQATLLGRVVYLQWASVDAARTHPLPLAFSDALAAVFER